MVMEYAGVESRYAARLYSEQVRLLYQSAPLAYFITFANGAILAFVESAYISRPVVLVWYGVLATVTAIRAGFVWRYAKVRPAPAAARRWSFLFVAGTAVAGSVWGATAFVFIPSSSLAHEVFVAFVLAGMSAGSITVLSFRMEACLAFLFPVLLPLSYRYLTLGATLHTVMGIMTSIFLVGMVISALNFNRSVRASLVLRLDKRELEREIIRRNRAEEALSLEKDRLLTVLSSIGEGVALIDANGSIEYLNSVAERLCGCSADDALRRQACEVFGTFGLERHERTSTAMEESLRTAKQMTKQTIMMHEGGDRCVIEEVATPLFDSNGKVVGAVAIFHDVTETLQKAEQLAYAADHDVLTGLPNRNLLNSRMQQAIAHAQRRQETFALLFLDLDRFKEINDTMGHAAGDAVLVNVAQRLIDTVREEDTIVRLGGDEFVVLLEGPTEENDVKTIVDKISRILCHPYQLGGQSASISVSIGTSFFPAHGHNLDALLGHADAAMYRAKKR